MFWEDSSQYLLGSVFVLQKMAVRLLAKAGYINHCKHVFIKLQILTLTSLILFEKMRLMPKNNLGISLEPRQYNYRQNNNLVLPISHSTMIINSIIYKYLKMFNFLPNFLEVC